MILETVSQLDKYLESLPPRRQKKFSRVLMVRPTHFEIQYAINPYMEDERGNLKKVDQERAFSQWKSLKSAYEKLGFPVSVIEGAPGLPDMVFAANQCFPFWDLKGDPKVLLSKMRSDFRQGEISFFEKWLKANDYSVLKLHDPSVCFEGNGDAFYHPELPLILGAFGPRTDRAALDEITELSGIPVVTLQLKTKEFYHLDTCLSVINADTAVVQPEAFSPEDFAKIQRIFPKLITVTFEENRKYFCGNCHSPNGKDVLTYKGADDFNEKLEASGLTVHEIDTSEFLKSGGSVFCMKMMLP
jgi:N-dimethylarginine dimethylaminohydrolase